MIILFLSLFPFISLFSGILTNAANTANHWNEWEDLYEIGKRYNLWACILTLSRPRPISYRANQWTGFYMISTSDVKGLKYSCKYLSSGTKAMPKLHTESDVWKLVSSKYEFSRYFSHELLYQKEKKFRNQKINRIVYISINYDI